MGTVAYFEGTDPLILTKLVLNGIDTLPVSNGYDNHGLYVNHITKGDDVAVVVGYLHKVIPTPKMEIKPKDILYTCIAYKIPVLLICPKDEMAKAQEKLGDVGDIVKLVEPDPDRIFEEIKKYV